MANVRFVCCDRGSPSDEIGTDAVHGDLRSRPLLVLEGDAVKTSEPAPTEAQAHLRAVQLEMLRLQARLLPKNFTEDELYDISCDVYCGQFEDLFVECLEKLTEVLSALSALHRRIGR